MTKRISSVVEAFQYCTVYLLLSGERLGGSGTAGLQGTPEDLAPTSWFTHLVLLVNACSLLLLHFCGEVKASPRADT